MLLPVLTKASGRTDQQHGNRARSGRPVGYVAELGMKKSLVTMPAQHQQVEGMLIRVTAEQAGNMTALFGMQADLGPGGRLNG